MKNDKRIKNLNPWKPGQSGNPKGKPPTPKDLRDARKLNAIEVSRILNKFSNLTTDELREKMMSLDTPALELMIGKVMLECMKSGDDKRLNFILDRMVGKVTEKMEVKLPKPTVVKLIGEDAVMVLGHAEKRENDEEV